MFRYGGNPANVASIPVFNNSFHAIRLFRVSPSFSEMTGEIVCARNRYLNQKALNPSVKTFRVRFVRENRFEAVSSRMMATAESEIKKSLHLSVNRVNPDTEFWYMIRKENTAFYAQLLAKRAVTEKRLNKGAAARCLLFILRQSLCVFLHRKILILPCLAYLRVQLKINRRNNTNHQQNR